MSGARVAPLPPTVAVVLEDAVRRLAAAGVATPRLDARLLIGDALGCEPGALALRAGERLDADTQARIDRLIARRAAREPVARIRGSREFWSLKFRVGPATLDPRPDSETLVEAALAAVGDRASAVDVLDLGTGTGCLLLAVLTELPQARGLGVDISADAVAVARDNAQALGLGGRARFAVADWRAPAAQWAGPPPGGRGTAAVDIPAVRGGESPPVFGVPASPRTGTVTATRSGGRHPWRNGAAGHLPAPHAAPGGA